MVKSESDLRTSYESASRQLDEIEKQRQQFLPSGFTDDAERRAVIDRTSAAQRRHRGEAEAGLYRLKTRQAELAKLERSSSRTCTRSAPKGLKT